MRSPLQNPKSKDTTEMMVGGEDKLWHLGMHQNTQRVSSKV